MHLITTLGFSTYKSDDVIVVTGVNYGVASSSSSSNPKCSSGKGYDKNLEGL